jgi:hypothetical protein
MDQYFDFTSADRIDWSKVVGGIWVPSPPVGSPGAPTFSGTATVTAGPPPTVSAMLISQPSSGDLFRLAVAPPQDNPAHLSGDCKAGSALTQADLDRQTANAGAQTTDLPLGLQYLYGVLTLGLYIPRSVTISAASLMLPQAPAAGFLTLTLTGTVTVHQWWSNSDKPFTLTASVALAPSGDPVDTFRILAATPFNASMSIIGGLIVVPALLSSMAAQATTYLEQNFNLAIPQGVAQALAELDPPQQLSPNAVISAYKVDIKPAELTLTLSIADLSEPAIVPIPPNMFVEVTPMPQCGEKRNYVVAVYHGQSPIGGAVVTFETGAGGPIENGGPAVKGTTGPDGTVQLNDVTLSSYLYTRGGGKGPPKILKFNPVLTVSAAGFKEFTSEIDCPVP